VRREEPDLQQNGKVFFDKPSAWMGPEQCVNPSGQGALHIRNAKPDFAQEPGFLRVPIVRNPLTTCFTSATIGVVA
jgi:hypothetical protein